MTFEELLEEYFFARLLRPATKDCYRTAVEQFTHWRNVLPAEVTPHLALEWRNYLLNERDIKPVSWNHYMRHLRALYNFTIRQGLLTQFINPFMNITLRESRRRKKTVTHEQIILSREVLHHYIEQEKTQYGYRSPFYPAWFWLAAIETFNYTAIRLNSFCTCVAGISICCITPCLSRARGAKAIISMSYPSPPDCGHIWKRCCMKRESGGSPPASSYLISTASTRGRCAKVNR